MFTNELEKALRGCIDMTPLEVEELRLLRDEIMSRKGNKDELRAIFEAKSRYIQAGIPKLYWDIGWDDFYGDQDAKKLIQKYCTMLDEAIKVGQGVILSGKHGTGKTSLSCLIAKAAIDKGYTVKYIAVSKIIDMIMHSFDDKEYKANLNTVMERVEFLVLDDLGKEYLGIKKQLNPMVQLNLDSFLRERVNRCRVTIVSTNLELESLKSQYGDSVLSIIYGACRAVEIKGDDFRLLRGKDFWGKIDGR